MSKLGYRRLVKRVKFKSASRMRKNPTAAEAAFWDAYTAIKPTYRRVPIRRQAIIFGYIADFWFCSRRVILEIDGGYHDDPAVRVKDQTREAHLCGRIQGLRIVRVRNEEVLKDPVGFAKEFNHMLHTLPIYRNWIAKEPSSEMLDGLQKHRDIVRRLHGH